MMSSCSSLLFFFLSVHEPLNPNPFISRHIPVGTRSSSTSASTVRSPSCALLHVLHVHLHADASLLLHVEALRNHAVRLTITAAPESCRQDHTPPPPAPPPSSGPRLPDLFHLQQFDKPSSSVFPSPSVIMLRSLLI
jgi:hypothetical protein